MDGREFLGPELQRACDLVGSVNTLDLMTLSSGDKVFVCVGPEPFESLDFEIVTPASAHDVDKSAVSLLPRWKFEGRSVGDDGKKMKVLIGASGTWNPESRVGMTMCTPGVITVGRALIIWNAEEPENRNIANIYAQIDSIVVLHVDK